MGRNYKHEYHVVKNNEIIKVFFGDQDQEDEVCRFAMREYADFIRHIIYVDSYYGDSYNNQYKKCHESLIWTKEQGKLPSEITDISIGSLDETVVHEIFEGLSRYMKEMYGSEPADFEITGNITIKNIEW